MNEITESLLITLFNDEIDNTKVTAAQTESLKILAPILAKVLLQVENIQDNKIKELQGKISDLQSEIHKINNVKENGKILNDDHADYDNIKSLDKENNVNCNGKQEKENDSNVEDDNHSINNGSVSSKANKESDTENDKDPPDNSTSDDGTKSTPEEIAYCHYCKKLIRDSIVRAMGKTWCKNHFMCFTPKCGTPLIGKDIHHLDGSLYCSDCHSKYHVPKCHKCKEPVGEKYMDALDKLYHPECFRCANCKGIIGSGQFYIEQGKPYCATVCKHLFAKKCASCRSPIQAGDTFVEALSKTYHKLCFKCSDCKKPLEGMSFFLKDGKPVCKLHAKPKLKREVKKPL
ncbi:unnamed protein product [Meganyctiphanes norvegica]|uniref:LIM zinc-binding domain-containing protein n=1 Tax=Meganyctiphanes norvegica TaxID=48144 RepID=A0AAV2QZB7_MEGNR